MPHTTLAASGAALLLDIFWKSLPVFAVAGLAALALRRAPAAARHALWLLALAALLCLPVFCALLPRWAAPVLPAAPPALVAARPMPPVVAPPEVANVPTAATAGTAAVGPAMTEAAPPPPAVVDLPVRPTPPAHRLTLAEWVCLAWLIGALLVLGRTLLGLAAAGRLVRRCRAVTAGPLVEDAAEAQRALSLTRPLCLRLGAVAVPMTCGVRRPMILLPSDAGGWPEGRLRAVLLHEAAHVKRLDWATLLLARLACALYWPHPLAWLAAHRLRAEAEASCDDLVLTSGGIPAPDYAAYLLEIVRALAANHSSVPGTVAMASRLEIVKRLHVILDARRSRGDVSRRRLGLAGLTTLAALIPLAALTATSAHRSAPLHYLSAPAMRITSMLPANPRQVQTTVLPFTLTATLARNVAAGQPVVLSLSLRNNGTQRFIINGSAFEPSSFDFAVADAAGQGVARTAVGDRVLTPPGMAYANTVVTISPGQTMSYQFNLDRLFDLSRSGNYTVRVTRTLRPQTWGGQGSQVQPSVTLTLPPLKVHMVEDASTANGPVDATPPRGATYLYLTSPYYPGVGRYLVGENGSVSSVLGPSASNNAPRPAPVFGVGPGAPVATPDRRFLYCGNGDHTISQFHIIDNGTLSPLVPPSIPATKGPGALLMDPRGRFLYDLNGLAYIIGPGGRLRSAEPVASPVVPAGASGSYAFTPDGAFLYISNGLTHGYRVSGDGRMRPLPPPATAAAGGPTGCDNAVTFTPSGHLALIGTSTQSGSAYFDRVTPSRVGPDGSLTPIPGFSVPTAPPQPIVGQVSHASTFLTVDPGGRFLFVGDSQGIVGSYRIGTDGKLTVLGTTSMYGGVASLFFIPGQRFAYALSQNPSSLLAFRLDDQHGLVPAGLDMPSDIPFQGLSSYQANVASGSAPGSDQWGPAAAGLDVALRLPATTQPATRPVILTVLLRNVSGHPLSLGLNGDTLSSLRLTLTGPPAQITGGLRGQGESATAPARLLTAGRDLLEAPVGSDAPLVLPPGGVRAYRLTLSRLFDMSVAGFYTVQVSRRLPGGATASSPVVTLLREGPFNGIKWYGSGTAPGGIGSGCGLSVM